MIKARRLLIQAAALSWAIAWSGAGPAVAQQSPAYTLEDVVGFVAAGAPATAILTRLNRDCINFRVDAQAEARLRTAGADAAFIEALQSVCYRAASPPVEPLTPQPAAAGAVPVYSPGSAMVRSFIVPGLGQFYTGRPALGVLFLGAWGAALGFGLLSQEVTTECLARVTDTCPAGQVRDEVTTRPMLAVGAGAAVAIAVISAIEANSAAKRKNREAGFGGGDSGARPQDNGVRPAIDYSPDRGLVLGLRIRF